MNSCSTVAFIWSPRQLLQSDTGVPHFALDPLTYRCLLSLSPAADFAEPRPPRHTHIIHYIEIFLVPLALIIVLRSLDMASGDSACFLAHGKEIAISLCICMPIALIKSAVIVNQCLHSTLEI